jgi:phosphatidylinositol glycan class K
VLVYLTGHGGDEFLKFQDKEEVASADLAAALQQMHWKKRYNEARPSSSSSAHLTPQQLLFLADTCQAATLAARFSSPRTVALSSSAVGEPSWSYQPDADVGLTVIDRFTHFTLRFLEPLTRRSNETLAQLFSSYSREALLSTATLRGDLLGRGVEGVRLLDFLGDSGEAEVEGTPEGGYAGFGDDKHLTA